jgi:hypothetical protein
MRSLRIFRVLGLSALAAIVGATMLHTAPKAEAGTVVAVGVGVPGVYAPYYPPYPYGYYAPYPAYYAPAPYYPAPYFPFSVGVVFGPHGYYHGAHYHGGGYYHGGYHH